MKLSTLFVLAGLAIVPAFAQLAAPNDMGVAMGHMHLYTKDPDALQAPTKGRVLDHIGFEVKNIDETVKRLDAAGIKIDGGAIRTSPNASKLRIAFITDPWGTYIELTNGLTP